MAMVHTTAFEELYMEFADDNGNYTHYAGMTTKNISHNTSLATSEVPDTDEGLPATSVSGIKSITEEISGTLTMIPADYQFYRTWWQEGSARNVRVTVTKPQGNGGGRWVTSYILSSLKISGDANSEAMNLDITLTSTGKIGTFVAGDQNSESQRILPQNTNP